MTTSLASPSLLESIFNHVALPARLPSYQSRLDNIELELTERTLLASKELSHLTYDQYGHEWESLRRSLRACKLANAGGRLNKPSLITAFRELQEKDFIALHVVEQNAALLIRRQKDSLAESVVFEAFEASPLSETALTSNALEWDFPGCATAIPVEVFNDALFQNELAARLEQASKEQIKNFAPRAFKDGTSTFESRDTVDPTFITNMLMTFLEANGKRIFPPITRKRVRDEVSWSIGAVKPWRRAPFWLILRVATQRHLSTLLGGEIGRLQYKFLICLVLSNLMNDSIPSLHLEHLCFLKAKLCRRLVKLESDNKRDLVDKRGVYDYMLLKLTGIFQKSITNATRHIENEWASYKSSIQRPIPNLPKYANDRHLELSLPNSGRHLQQLLYESRFRTHVPNITAARSPALDFDLSAAVAKSSTPFINHYFAISETEEAIESNYSCPLSETYKCEKQCMLSSRVIGQYLDAVANSYNFSPELTSIKLLTVMELWMSMDECAIKVFGLLKDFSPLFPVSILDPLLLAHVKDMSRVQKIRAYLRKRHSESKGDGKTIFHNPEAGCFAERYYDESDDSQRLQQLRKHIEDEGEFRCNEKKECWQENSKEFEDLNRIIAGSTCISTTNGHSRYQCTKCSLEFKAKGIRMSGFEEPLPRSAPEAKAVVFELTCPEAFVAYRDATWKIIGTLAVPNLGEDLDERWPLQKYSELRAYTRDVPLGVSLASYTKSWLTTHYGKEKHLHFPLGWEDVWHTNALKFWYFDSKLKVWPARHIRNLTFAHHCKLVIPTSSPFSCLRFSPEFVGDVTGPSSYQVVANQSKCPPGLNVHEFSAFQTLVSGKTRRWPQIILELGASNLNFSTEATTWLMSFLVLQMGPAHETNSFGEIHRIFGDPSFARRLFEQLNRRIDAISSNWRETNSMETMITLLLRLNSLHCGSTVSMDCILLLEKTRAITFNWITILRLDIQNATDLSTAQRCSKYAFWSALLCRRTFAAFSDDKPWESTALRCFLECAIVLQDNLVSDPATLDPLQKHAFIRDMKMVSRMAPMLKESLQRSPESLELAIASVWPDVEGGQPRVFSKFKFLCTPDEWWVEMVVDATARTTQQVVHFHLLRAHLLVMGKPVGKLPAEWTKSVILEQLFPHQSLMTFPSSLPGMSYMLVISMSGHQIHLGFRDGNLIVRACLYNTVLEFVPRQIFGNLQHFDLPASLVLNCVHWLDLNTGLIEIRQGPKIWVSRPSNWTLDLNTRRATRRNSTLINPQSPIFRLLGDTFENFENRHHLTAFQPAKGRLTVELRRLELSFSVNDRNVLESSQLQCEIDRNQDAGTWYGLDSKLVLREVTRIKDPSTGRQTSVLQRQRSILVPMGNVNYRCKGPHNSVCVDNNGDYGRYTINEALCRLDCPAEPRLLYLKALYHAYTSFLLPDPLTGLTGTEAAIHCLKSGYCQPWIPLTLGQDRSLILLGKFTPRREYYPATLKVMQTVSWDPHLTTTVQNDEFRNIVDGIRHRSEDLSIFAQQKVELPPLDPAGDFHLTSRSQIRRRAYQRQFSGSTELASPLDNHYASRDRPKKHQKPTECI